MPVRNWTKGYPLTGTEVNAIIDIANVSEANDPTAAQKAALAGTNGTPGTDNRFVTNTDPRNSDARTPAMHGHAFSDITDTPTTVGGYGITDAAEVEHGHDFGDITDTPTTVDGYGITDAIDDSDARLTDARTPLAHDHAPGDVTGTAVITTDSRLSDARTPTAHTHAPADVTGTAVITSDSRLSDARTPVAHDQAFSTITSTPTTLGGYGITDAASSTHDHDSAYEPINANIQAHVTAEHAPSDAQKNSDITKEEIEAKLTGQIATHTHAGGGGEAFPVGSVFLSVVATNPNTLLGYGTWSAFGAGRVLVGLDSGDASFDTVEETGGSKTHTLLAAEMPSHTHTQGQHRHLLSEVRSATTGSDATLIARTSDTSSTRAPSDPFTDYATATNEDTGGGGAHNNVQPYIVVHMWKRTA